MNRNQLSWKPAGVVITTGLVMPTTEIGRGKKRWPSLDHSDPKHIYLTDNSLNTRFYNYDATVRTFICVTTITSESQT